MYDIMPTEEAENMKLRLAEESDLPKLKTMYKKIIENMNEHHIQIWDDYYPCEYFPDDVKAKTLYLLTDSDNIVSAFVLCKLHDGEKCINWESTKEKAMYIDRFGVNVDNLRRGIGSMTLKYAMDIAKQRGAKYLRLFVVDINEPAICLYQKNGFTRMTGQYEEKIDDFILYEYGFENKL